MASLAAPPPRILLLVPIAPAPRGNGLAMRAATAVRGLARAGELSVAILPVSGPRPDRSNLAWCAEHASRAVAVELPTGSQAAASWLATPLRREIAAAGELPARARLASPAAGEAALEALGGREFEAVYVLRLYLAGAALPLLEQPSPPYRVLDADDDDVATFESMARLHEVRREPEAAAKQRAAARAHHRLAAAVLPHFDRLLAASPAEASDLGARYGVAERVATLPNAVEAPPDSPKERTSSTSMRLLFVGNLDYPPNLDAVERLIDGVLPVLRAREPQACVDVIGAGGGPALQARRGLPGVRIHGAVQSLAPHYQRATAVVAPLRAGGGSRIKLLEAFAWGVPVVASPQAAAGLAVAHERELLLADSDSELSAAVLRIARDGELARRLVGTAARFVATHHDLAVISSRLASIAGIGTRRPGGSTR